MRVICLDVEGVLLPEIWINVAKTTGIEALERTTRDEPDYRKLMMGRIEILRHHGLTIRDIRNVIAQMDPLDGAIECIESLRTSAQLILLSDTFEEFAQPLMKKLGWPTLFCNSLEIDNEGFITGFRLRQEDGKRKAVEALISINFEVYAAGDSYNDLSMIRTAHKGALFHAPQNIIAQYPELPAFDEYDDLSAFLLQGMV